jgi:hypothetical protein
MKKDLVGKRVDEGKIHVITNAVWDAAVADTNGIRSKIRSRLGIGIERVCFRFCRAAQRREDWTTGRGD